MPDLSDELIDEVEAINSIYGEDSLVQSSGDDAAVFILQPPCESASFRVRFSPRYPDEPPSVLATHSAGRHVRPGLAARDLDLFRLAVASVYEPGQVCLFDAVEKLQELLLQPSPSPSEDEEGVEGGGEGEGGSGRTADTEHAPATTARGALPIPEVDPPWTLSAPLTEMRSTFLARAAPATSPEQAASYVAHLLATDKKARAATHNITAWRIRGPRDGTAFQDCDDDGETAAGGRLLHLMQLMDLWDAVVVVTRWYGGQKLGPRRFAVINMVARDAFVRAGMVPEPPPAGKKKGGGGK